jgi:hypothetical protein
MAYENELTPASIVAAAQRLKGRVLHTPLEPSDALSEAGAVKAHLKLENPQSYPNDRRKCSRDSSAARVPWRLRGARRNSEPLICPPPPLRLCNHLIVRQGASMLFLPVGCGAVSERHIKFSIGWRLRALQRAWKSPHRRV